MKRLVMFLMTVSSAGVLVLVGGCGKQNGQTTQTYSAPEKTTGTIENHGSSDLGVGAPSIAVKSLREPPETSASIQGSFSLSNTREPEENFTVNGPDDLPTFTLSGGALSSKLGNVATNDQRTIRSPEGTIYVGEISNGQPSGQGTYTDPQGTHQQGEFRDGKPYRITGTWISTDGIKEEGAWNFDGSKSGGTITWPDGRVYRGNWKNMDGVPETPEGVGAMVWPDGRKYMGQFHNGKMDGAGRMTYPGGKVQDGLWMDGNFTGSVP
jgi:hypothetical protein